MAPSETVRRKQEKNGVTDEENLSNSFIEVSFISSTSFLQSISVLCCSVKLCFVHINENVLMF